MSPTPTALLVHGAFADAGSWSGVIAELRNHGIPVVAPPNPLRGLASDAAYIASVASQIDGPVVLVGHSYGGVLISRAAQELPNVDALVYIAAFQPDTDDSALGLATRFPGAKLGPDTTAVLVHDGEPELRIKSEDFRDVFAGDLPADTTRVMAATQRPVTEKALTTGLSGEPAWRRLPSWALVATQDNAIPAQAQEFMAERAGSKVVRVDASHAVAVSNPDAVTDLIIEAAKATA